ncbi:hypothetical protein DFR58_12259 [Anaerobacterium chartisolvens]|uniref:Uncharacterized protein n=1 Tax=Anaerobacterium chartisolvens TaxID=1297424 RepID=A0A369ASM8_9FIRM|nr:hypothetical protein [Anaerobacterium chartisolvens]RCX12370.1 hypothetical protein DFR58_12259 [Anaerobacterium chartisolvens]
MKSILDGSILFGILHSITVKLEKLYRASVLYRALRTLGLWCSQSVIGTLVDKYMKKSSKAKSSVTYRVLRFIGIKLDYFAGLIHNLFIKAFGHSLTGGLTAAIKEECKSSMYKVGASLILPFAAGFAAVTTIRGTWSMMKTGYMLMLFILLLASFISISRWKSWIKGSVVYKLCHSIWE